MMIDWQTGIVVKIIEELNDIQIVTVKHNKGESTAIHYLQFHLPLSVGDQVILNQTATQLKLGTGGYDFIVSPLPIKRSEEVIDNRHRGHIMKLRYTPYQFSVLSCEEQDSPYHEIFKEPKKLEKLPVLIGELHSMLPVITTVFRQLELKNQLEVKNQLGLNHRMKKKKIVYIMTDGAALPIALSQHVRELKKLEWLDQTITVGKAFGGDCETVNFYTALIAAKYISQADMVIALMGPGITGTGTWLGHTGVEQGIMINAVSSLGGLPITVIRASIGDHRKRHQGISHHTLANLNIISLTESIAPFPEYIKTEFPLLYNELKGIENKHVLSPVPMVRDQTGEFLLKYPLPIKTMGRSFKDDPLFFDFAASAAYWVFHHLYNA